MVAEASSWMGARGQKWRAQLTGMEAMLEAVDQPLIEALELDRPLRIVEVGCGGGGTALRLAREAPAGSTVLGVDISPALIEVAKGRVTAVDGALGFRLADAAQAPPGEARYERLVSRFGVMFFEQPESAFANLARWLTIGGRFAFAVWGPVADNAWLKVVRDVVAEVAVLPEMEPDAPGPFRYAAVDELLVLLTRAGFGELAVRDFRSPLPIGGGLPAARAAEFSLAAFATFAELLEQAGPAALENARRLLSERLAAHEQDGHVRLQGRVHIVSGVCQKEAA
jgi:SAM-dependent methyltransferase